MGARRREERPLAGGRWKYKTEAVLPWASDGPTHGRRTGRQGQRPTRPSGSPLASATLSFGLTRDVKPGIPSRLHHTVLRQVVLGRLVPVQVWSAASRTGQFNIPGGKYRVNMRSPCTWPGAKCGLATDTDVERPVQVGVAVPARFPHAPLGPRPSVARQPTCLPAPTAYNECCSSAPTGQLLWRS